MDDLNSFAVSLHDSVQAIHDSLQPVKPKQQQQQQQQKLLQHPPVHILNPFGQTNTPGLLAISGIKIYKTHKISFKIHSIYVNLSL